MGVPHLCNPQSDRDLWIRRKVTLAAWAAATPETRNAWRAERDRWVALVESLTIRAVVIDYDGTLCEVADRFGTPATTIGAALTRLIEAGMLVGVATGRGDSVLKRFRSQFQREGVGTSTCGNVQRWSVLLVARNARIVDGSARSDSPCARTARAGRQSRGRRQLSPASNAAYRAGASCCSPGRCPARFVREAIAGHRDLASLHVYASGHTVDIVADGISKTLVVETLRNELGRTGADGAIIPPGLERTPSTPFVSERVSPHVMTIGDQGQAGGSDSHSLCTHWA